AQGGDVTSGSLTSAGWGTTDESSHQLSPALLKVSIPVVTREECAKRYAAINAKVTENMVCAGLTVEGGQDACMGDSGGPAMDDQGVLAGLISWGAGCAHTVYPSVHTRVGSYIDWIKQQGVDI